MPPTTAATTFAAIVEGTLRTLRALRALRPIRPIEGAIVPVFRFAAVVGDAFGRVVYRRLIALNPRFRRRLRAALGGALRARLRAGLRATLCTRCRGRLAPTVGARTALATGRSGRRNSRRNSRRSSRRSGGYGRSGLRRRGGGTTANLVGLPPRGARTARFGRIGAGHLDVGRGGCGRLGALRARLGRVEVGIVVSGDFRSRPRARAASRAFRFGHSTTASGTGCSRSNERSTAPHAS